MYTVHLRWGVAGVELGLGGGEGGGSGRAGFLFPTGRYLGHITKKAEKIEWSGKSASQIFSFYLKRRKETLYRVLFLLSCNL